MRNNRPIRILTAVPLCDGHDSAIVTINFELARHGAEVIYLGYHCPASAIARAAVQEDVDAIGISSYNGGHVVFFREVIDQLRQLGANDIRVFGGGGGTITAKDASAMKRFGVERIFFAGTSLDKIAQTISRAGRHLKSKGKPHSDLKLAREISRLEKPKVARTPQRKSKTFVVGISGPGGAGKSTLIDELVLRYLNRHPTGRVAVLANDPTHPDSGGAILGDRASMIYSQHDRVFMRSLATRGHGSGISRLAPATINLLKTTGEFDLVFVESVGIGQDSDPFRLFGRGPRLVDLALFVMAASYGGPIQLQKIGMLSGSEFVVLNKCDRTETETAKVEIASRLEGNHKGQRLFTTIAARHADKGIDELSDAIEELAKR